MSVHHFDPYSRRCRRSIGASSATSPTSTHDRTWPRRPRTLAWPPTSRSSRSSSATRRSTRPRSGERSTPPSPAAEERRSPRPAGVSPPKLEHGAERRRCARRHRHHPFQAIAILSRIAIGLTGCRHTPCMASSTRRKTSFEVDVRKLQEAKDILGTRTLTDTVDAALSEVVKVQQRKALWSCCSRRELSRSRTPT